MKKVLLVADYLREYPKATGTQVAKKFKCALSYAYVLMSKAKAIIKFDEMADDIAEEISDPVDTRDLVNHPEHYKVGGIETIDFIEAKDLNYHLGNVVKYITRSNYKGEKLKDLKKAQWYLNRAIENLELFI